MVTKEQKERFLVLLEQLKMTSDEWMPYFREAAIRKVVIDKEEKSWHFHFQLANVLPVDVYKSFTDRLAAAFRHIAAVRHTIYVEEPHVTETDVQAYWPLCLEQLQEGVSPLVDLLSRQTPAVKGNKLFVTARHDAEALAVKRRFAKKIADVYASFGFPLLHLEVGIQPAEQEMERFLAQKQQEDEERALAVLTDLAKEEEKAEAASPSGPLVIGYPIRDEEPVRPLETIVEEERRVVVQGYVFDAEVTELKSGRTLLTMKITDYTNSIVIKMFSRDKEDAALMSSVKKSMWVKVRGSVQNDTFVRDLVIIANDLNEVAANERRDTAPEGEKRVELHLHTPMSQMDAVTSVAKLIEQAKKWGHPAVAITDHAVVQSFPEAYSAAKKHGMKVLYGMEANIVDDGVPIAYNEAHRRLSDETYVVFDVETTGLSAVYNTIIELAAVKVKDGEIIDRFMSFANPHHPLSVTTMELTGITDEMVKDAPDVEEVLRRFIDWVGDFDACRP